MYDRAALSEEAKVVFALHVVACRLPPANLIKFSRHTKQEFCHRTIRIGDRFMYEMNGMTKVAVAASFIEICGCRVVLHYLYGSSIIKWRGHKAVDLNSIDDTSPLAIELNTHNFTLINVFEKDENGTGVGYLLCW